MNFVKSLFATIFTNLPLSSPASPTYTYTDHTPADTHRQSP